MLPEMEKTDGGKEGRGMAEESGGEMKSGESELEGGLRQIDTITLSHAAKQTAQLSHPAKLPEAVSTRGTETHRPTFPLGEPEACFWEGKADEFWRKPIN